MWYHENNDAPWPEQGAKISSVSSDSCQEACDAFYAAAKKVETLENLIVVTKNAHEFVGTRVSEAAAMAAVTAIAAGQAGWAGSLLANYMTPSRARELAKDARNRARPEHVRNRAQAMLTELSVSIDEDFLTLIKNDLVSACLPAAIATEASAKEAWEQELEKE